MIKKLSLVAGLLLAAVVPFAAKAEVGVSVAVSTPEFGIRIGAPFYGPRVYAQAPGYVPAPVYSPVIYSPPTVVYVPAPVVIPVRRVAYPAPVIVPPPRVVYSRGYVIPPRVPFGHAPHPRGYASQHAGYRVPPGQLKHASVKGRYQ